MSFLPNESSRASIVLGFVKDHCHDAGQTITYSEMLGLVDVDASVDDPTLLLSGVVAEVNKRLHRDGDWRHLANVPTVGYRIASTDDLRSESFARMRRSERQQIANQRAIEKVIRHPDATPNERKRAADASAAQAALLMMMRREQRKIRQLWPAEETSPVILGP
jgi:hypothetical protein